MKVAVVQINAGPNKARNISRALRLAEQAAGNQAEFILFPEVFNYRGPHQGKDKKNFIAETIPGESSKPFLLLAKKHKVHILLGSLFEKIPNTVKSYNTSVLINAKGQIKAQYRKIHLFDAVVHQTPIKESDLFRPGRRVQVSSVKGFKIGMSICYDVRFPLIYQKYRDKGVDVICVPSSFTRVTGAAHWEVLLRARAIESLSYILAPNQTGKDHRGVECFGNSLIINPWGEILARGAGRNEQILYADLKKEELDRVQKILPNIRK